MQVNISYAQTNIVCEVRKSRNSTICDLIGSMLITIHRAGCACSRLCIAFHGKIQYNIMIVSDRHVLIWTEKCKYRYLFRKNEAAGMNLRRHTIHRHLSFFQHFFDLAAGTESCLTQEFIQTHHAFILHPEKYLFRRVPRISLPQPSGYPSTQTNCHPASRVLSPSSISMVSPFR